MSTFRTFSLTATGLLLSLGATAQSTAMSPANEDMLSWMLRVLLGAVGIVTALVFIALLTAAANRSSVQQERADALASTAATLTAVAAPAAAPVAAPAATPAPSVVASVPIPALFAQELVLSE
jgi:type IV secretory pathway VirB2 component (pilin)